MNMKNLKLKLDHFAQTDDGAERFQYLVNTFFGIPLNLEFAFKGKLQLQKGVSLTPVVEHAYTLAREFEAKREERRANFKNVDGTIDGKAVLALLFGESALATPEEEIRDALTDYIIKCVVRAEAQARLRELRLPPFGEEHLVEAAIRYGTATHKLLNGAPLPATSVTQTYGEGDNS